MTRCPRCAGLGRAPWIFNREVVDHVRCSLCQGTGKLDAPRGRGAKARDKDGDPGRETSDFFPSDPSED